MAALVAILLVQGFIITFSRVEGSSMLPTLAPGQLIVINRLQTTFTSPKVGDIVVIQLGTTNPVRMVKRISAVAGTTIHLPTGETAVLQEDQFYVLGDNSSQSIDSRSYGPIPASAIVGTVTTWLQ